MKIKYDQEVDILLLQFSDEAVHESDQPNPGIILDYDKEGHIVRIEVLDASTRTNAPFTLNYELVAG